MVLKLTHNSVTTTIVITINNALNDFILFVGSNKDRKKSSLQANIVSFRSEIFIDFFLLISC